MKKIAPTKSNLMKTRDELKFARLGFDLLDQKRSILVSELVNLTERAETQQRALENTLAEAYKSLEKLWKIHWRKPTKVWKMPFSAWGN